jgi:hypothetical protein
MDRSGKLAAIGLSVWFVIALVVGASGLLSHAKPPAPQILIAVLSLVSLGLIFGIPTLRQWSATVSLRLLVAVHLTRFVGFYFLYLAERNELAPAFAIPAGRGDIAVAAGALLLLFTRPESPVGRRFYQLWNVLGTLDILLVIINAAQVGLADPDSMQALLRIPLNLLPTFLVPVIIVSHVLLFHRLFAPSPLSPEKPLHHV